MNYINRSENNVVIGYVSWGAIFAGVVAALGVASLLNLLGVGLGLAGFSVDSQVIKNLSIATIFWLAFNSVVSMFVGGWVAGLLAGKLENRVENLLHGFLTWSITMMMTFWLATTAVGFTISGAVGITQRALASASSGVVELGAAAAPQLKTVVNVLIPQDGEFMNNVNGQAQKIFEQAQKTIQRKASDIEAVGASSVADEALNKSNEQFSQAIQKFFKAVGSDNEEKSKEVVINILVDQGGMSETRANDLVSSWLERYLKMKNLAKEKTQQAQQKAINITEKTSSVLSKIALLSLLTLLLGAVAACVGAVMGVKTD